MTVAWAFADETSDHSDARRPDTSRLRIVHHDDAPTSHAKDADATLVAALRAGDARALEAIVREHLPLLVRIAHRYGQTGSAAEDLVQDVLATVWERRATLHIQTTVRGYLVAMVRNGAVSRFRHERVEVDMTAAFTRAGE